MYAMPCDSVTVRGTKVILTYRPADRGYSRYVTLDKNIKPFHEHFALYDVDGNPTVFGVSVIDNLTREKQPPHGDYTTIANLWAQKYHRRVSLVSAFTVDTSMEGSLEEAIVKRVTRHWSGETAEAFSNTLELSV